MSLKKVSADELVEFKGNKKGIIVNIKKVAPFDVVRDSIVDRLEEYVGFFNGAKICEINCDYLSSIQIMILKEELTSKFDIEFTEDEERKILGIFDTKYIENLRSGENIAYDGDIVVMQDMKPGSQLNSVRDIVIMGDISAGARAIAAGNIIVMGKVEGFVHAGANGNDRAYIVGNCLCPKVLQIADNIAEAPEDDETNQEVKEISPEIAFVREGRIVIESYLPKNMKKKEIYRG